jgi:hypothetical protein
LNRELREASFPKGVHSFVEPKTQRLWGYAECQADQLDSIGYGTSSIGGLFLSTVEPFDAERFGEILIEFSSGGSRISLLHAAMKYCELKPAFAIWVYPSFDDPEISVFVVGQQFRMKSCK